METSINSQNISIRGAKIHYLEAGTSTGSHLLFLHGASFNSQTWREIGTLQLMAEQGYHAFAIDLPGYGDSQSPSVPREAFLLLLLEELALQQPVIVSPSMSGGYSLPLVASHPDKLRGFVAVAPVGIGKYREQLKGIETPTLAIWGSNDRLIPVSDADLLVQLMPNTRKVTLKNAGHACYMRATDEFHKHLIRFLKKLDLNE
ncbi:alpha/beta fold hydrolase [Gloeothece verrucosa]|uniref:Alpha/beta hydrolase fold protein n=1 Tax=Gloeothece verrucosa (strain PCC 7822) TaxID=497965 RepID=E0UH51_GLOV7|nr:alpha/beta hydrolase [Gloeothece verrucosa]ADN15650.1 alpha/beta hydrolase fold protein [Gloeothece verrucosa PCC 7822]